MGVAAFAEQNQMVLGNSELVPPGTYAGIDPEKRVGITTYLPDLSQVVTFSREEPTPAEFLHADPEFIWKNGLLVRIDDPQFWQVHHMIRIGVERNSRKNKSLTTREHGLVFPVTEFDIVARNARDLGHHTVNKTATAQLRNSQFSKSPEETKEKYEARLRSAGHTLTGKMVNQKRLGAKYNDQLADFAIVKRDILFPKMHKSGHQKYKNAERRRAMIDEQGHEIIEVAGTRFDLEVVTLNGMHKALKRFLYNGNYPSSQFAANWTRLVNVLARNTAAKKEKLIFSYRECKAELAYYQPALDKKAAREAASLRAQEVA